MAKLTIALLTQVLPALFGQTAEASGRATKAAADKPAALGRLLSIEERREFRSGSHAQVSHSRVLGLLDLLDLLDLMHLLHLLHLLHLARTILECRSRTAACSAAKMAGASSD